MFPYPSGAGLHVGHPLGFIGTDVLGRYLRMTGRNVLHAMGFDAFGLPAEQYAVQTGTHPRTTTEANIARYKAQLRRLGLAHDERRSVATTDVDFYRWTQWIFLKIYGSFYDEEQRRARPVEELEAEFAAGTRPTPDGRPWAELSDVERRAVVDSFRLAYISEAPVNWCPGLGTVLANEEVTADGRSERGNFPVFRRNLKQWMMRITAYADRLAADLDRLDWPDSVKAMQRNWIGRSEGARVRFDVVGAPAAIEVFTTRPDTLFGATYMVLAPEHPLVEQIVPGAWPLDTDPRWTGGCHGHLPSASAAYRAAPPRAKSELDRQENKDKTGVFTGALAVNPVNGQAMPVFVADYVLMGYGTGAIMAVPGAGPARLGLRRGVRPADHPHGRPAGGLGRRGVHRRRPGDQLAQRRDQPGRAGRRRGQAGDHGLAGRQGRRRGRGAVQAARLAVLPAALLGRAVPDRLGRARPGRRCPTTSCPSSCPTSPTTRRGPTTRTTPTPSPSRR